MFHIINSYSFISLFFLLSKTISYIIIIIIILQFVLYVSFSGPARGGRGQLLRRGAAGPLIIITVIISISN